MSQSVEGQQEFVPQALSDRIYGRVPGVSEVNKLSRRDFLARAVGTISGATLLSGCAARQAEQPADHKKLFIYSWADYLHPETIPEFERRYGIEVVYDTFASNEALLAKMEAGGAAYDIIVPTNHGVEKLRQLKLLQAIDKERLPNFRHIMDRFRNPRFDPGCTYSIPYTFGTTGIAYNVDELLKRGVPTPRDWDIFWEPRLSHRMTLLEDARESLGLALKKNGHSYNTHEEPQIRQACRDLIGQKPLIMCYTSDQVIIYLASGDSLLSLAYSGDAHQARRTNNQVKYIIPASGASMWVDSMCIPVGSRNVENAYKWINFILEPHIAAALCNYTFYATPNAEALKLIEKHLLDDETLYPPGSVLDRCEEIADVGSAMFIFDRMWTELKCA